MEELWSAQCPVSVTLHIPVKFPPSELGQLEDDLQTWDLNLRISGQQSNALPLAHVINSWLRRPIYLNLFVFRDWRWQQIFPHQVQHCVAWQDTAPSLRGQWWECGDWWAVVQDELERLGPSQFLIYLCLPLLLSSFCFLLSLPSFLCFSNFLLSFPFFLCFHHFLLSFPSFLSSVPLLFFLSFLYLILLRLPTTHIIFTSPFKVFLLLCFCKELRIELYNKLDPLLLSSSPCHSSIPNLHQSWSLRRL